MLRSNIVPCPISLLVFHGPSRYQSQSLFTPPRNRGRLILSNPNGSCLLDSLDVLYYYYYTSTKSLRGYIFTSVCLSVCVCVSVSVSVCLIAFEQNPSQTDAPIWTLFSLNGWLLHWLESY